MRIKERICESKSRNEKVHELVPPRQDGGVIGFLEVEENRPTGIRWHELMLPGGGRLIEAGEAEYESNRDENVPGSSPHDRAIQAKVRTPCNTVRCRLLR